VGYGSTVDAFHVTAPLEDGSGAGKAISLAMEMANLNPEDIDYINAHGTGTQLNDVTETEAIKQVFGSHAGKLAVSSTKSMHGHVLGASSALELVATTLALHNDIIPPTVNFTEADELCDLDYVPNEARDKKLKAAMSNSFAFGGLNAVITLKKYQ
jgi:3-oxoacyl-[acyl-carrier-protein] synthase II